MVKKYKIFELTHRQEGENVYEQKVSVIPINDLEYNSLQEAEREIAAIYTPSYEVHKFIILPVYIK
jgi:hypothetical protein